MQTVAALQVSGLFPVTVGGLGATIKYFPQPFGAGIGLASTVPGQIAVPGSGRMNGQLMRVTANGTFTGGGSGSTAILALRINTAAQGLTPVYADLATNAAFTTVASAVYPWSITADLVGDTASGKVQGSFKIYINGLLNANTTVLSSVPTGVSFNSEYPFDLVVGVTFATTAATNSASMFQFGLEA